MKIFFKRALRYEKIGPAEVLRPSPNIRIEIREKAEAHLRQKFAPGTYTNDKTCNDILQHLFTFYDSEMERLLPAIATARWVGELLFQYEVSGIISAAFKKNELSNEQQTRWRTIGAAYRQSLDLICEKMAGLGEIDKISGFWQTQISDFERVLVCAEKCVEYSGANNYTYMVTPGATTITIHPSGSNPYFEHSYSEDVDIRIQEYHFQNHKEITLRDNYLDKAFDPFDHQYHASVLNDPLRKAFGIDYHEYQVLVTTAPASFARPTSYKNMPMCEKANLISQISEVTDRPTAIVQQVIESLILDTTTPRQVWNSRQLNRINKQPFLQFASVNRQVLMWSNQKVGDFLTLMDSDLTFNKPPKDWSHPDLVSAVTEISDAAGKWFERSVIKQLELLGFKGSRIKENTFQNYSGVVFDCGEIDYLGYNDSAKCLAIFEFKMVDTGFDARGIRQVRSSFMEGKNPFVKVFSKKINWVADNIEFVKDFIRQRTDVVIPNEIMTPQTAFITYYPTLMSLYFTDPVCKSLLQFVEDFQAKRSWPY